MEQDNNYTIAEEFELPSKGLVYSQNFDPYLKLKSMTVRDELKRTNAQAITIHRTLCEIIDSCLLTKFPISCYDMCIGDYEYLLHKLRVVTYGSEYKMIVGCPHCDSVHETVIDLDSLAVKDFDPKTFKELLDVTLPTSKKHLTLKFQTPRSLDWIEMKVRDVKKKQPEAGDLKQLFEIQSVIDEVDGVKLNSLELENFVDNLSARDANFILNRKDKINQQIGLDTSIDVTCKNCGGDIKSFFRFGPEFFRPTTD